jgi:hypothetical protein
MLSRTVPLPVVLAPETNVIHGTLVVAVHEHSGPDAVTLKGCCPPALGVLMVNPLTVNVHVVP